MKCDSLSKSRRGVVNHPVVVLWFVSRASRTCKHDA